MGFNAFLGDLGEGLASGIAKRFDEADQMRIKKNNDAYEDAKRMRQASQVQDILKNISDTPGWQTMPLSQKMLILDQALAAFPGVSKQVTGNFINASKIENMGRGLELNPERVQETAQYFEQLGYAPEEALNHSNIYHSLNSGSRTAYMKEVISEGVRRDGFSPKTQMGQNQAPQGMVEEVKYDMFGEQDQPVVQEVSPKKQMQQQTQNQRIQERDGEEKEFEYPPINDLYDRTTPAEKFRRQERYARENVKVVQDLNRKIKSADDEMRYVRQLKNIENTGKLPKGSKKILINPKSGEAYFPGTMNPETQLFIKTINDFTTKAKDSYGARVTNFDLVSFMKRLPNLANTSEGRRLIYAQMESINELDKLHNQSIRDTYKHYGANNINEERATSIAEEKAKKDKEKLLKKYDTVLDAVDIYEAKNDGEDHAGQVLIKYEGKLGWVPKEKLKIFEKKGAIQL